MRKALLTLLAVAALAVPAAALAGASAKGDGTVSVRDGNGKITIVGRGTFLGRVDGGRVTFTNLDPLDDAQPDFFGCDRERTLADGSLSCTGTEYRFRLVGAARYKIVVVARGIDLSGVGRGQLTMAGADAFLDDGEFAVNGGSFRAIPEDPLVVSFGQPPAPTPSP